MNLLEFPWPAVISGVITPRNGLINGYCKLVGL